MKSLITLVLFFLPLCIYSQSHAPKKKTSVVKKQKPTIEIIVEERKLRRHELLEVNTLRDLIPSIPLDCKINLCEFLSTTEGGGILANGSSNTGNDIQKLIKAQVARIIFVEANSSCNPKLNYKVIINDD